VVSNPCRVAANQTSCMYFTAGEKKVNIQSTFYKKKPSNFYCFNEMHRMLILHPLFVVLNLVFDREKKSQKSENFFIVVVVC